MLRSQLVGCLLLVVASSSALGARAIAMKIDENGKTVLKSYSGDDGHPDADDVWLYLHKARFEPTKDFKPKDGEKELVLENVEVSVQYGGFVKLAELRLTLKPLPKAKPDDKRVWAMDPKLIDMLFNHRFVRRTDIRRLKDPKRRVKRAR